MGCPACASARISGTRSVSDREYGIKFQAAYASCGDCGTAFQTPMPDLETLGSFYPKDYHSQTSRGILARLRGSLRLKRLKPFIGRGSVVLDYGCGNGAFILYAAEALPGVKFFGYEMSPKKEIKKLRDGSVTIATGSLGDLLEVLPDCDLITMNHVIEHLPDPLAVVSALCRKLRPGGAFEGQTPAAGSLEHRVFGAYWSGYHAPRHTVVFSSRGLNVFLKRAGFGSVRIMAAFNPASLGVSLASLAQGDSPSGIRRGGPAWLFWLGLAALLAPLDLLSGSPAIIDFTAIKK